MRRRRRWLRRRDQSPRYRRSQAPLDFGAGEGFVTRQVAIYPLDSWHRLPLPARRQQPADRADQRSDAEELRTFETPGSPPAPTRPRGPARRPSCPTAGPTRWSPRPTKKAATSACGETNQAAPAVLEQSSDSGEKLAFGSFRSFGGAASAPFTSQYIAQRIPDADGEYDEGEGWQTHSINSAAGTGDISPDPAIRHRIQSLLGRSLPHLDHHLRRVSAAGAAGLRSPATPTSTAHG